MFEAFILVAIVVYLFTEDFSIDAHPLSPSPYRSSVLFFMLIFNMSINLITLFALVAAIGVVVDDAIVVVEARTRRRCTKTPFAVRCGCAKSCMRSAARLSPSRSL
ncbi:MAG: efflux RND transporter permease subunit [Pirellulales bacterium]